MVLTICTSLKILRITTQQSAKWIMSLVAKCFKIMLRSDSSANRLGFVSFRREFSLTLNIDYHFVNLMAKFKPRDQGRNPWFFIYKMEPHIIPINVRPIFIFMFICTKYFLFSISLTYQSSYIFVTLHFYFLFSFF